MPLMEDHIQSCCCNWICWIVSVAVKLVGIQTVKPGGRRLQTRPWMMCWTVETQRSYSWRHAHAHTQLSQQTDRRRQGGCTVRRPIGQNGVFIRLLGQWQLLICGSTCLWTAVRVVHCVFSDTVWMPIWVHGHDCVQLVKVAWWLSQKLWNDRGVIFLTLMLIALNGALFRRSDGVGGPGLSIIFPLLDCLISHVE